MRELSATQLNNVAPANFLIPQFLFHFAGSLAWIAGLLFLIRSERLKDLRLLAWTYLTVILVLLLSGW